MLDEDAYARLLQVLDSLICICVTVDLLPSVGDVPDFYKASSGVCGICGLRPLRCVFLSFRYVKSFIGLRLFPNY